MKKYIASLGIVLVVIVLVIGARYYFLGPNLFCAEDSQGIRIYISKTDLPTYSDQIKNGRNWDVINQIRGSAPIYAEITNNCYGKNSYRIKNENGLADVSKKVFEEYVAKSFSENYCNNAVLFTQSGNGPITTSDHFCRFEK